MRIIHPCIITPRLLPGIAIGNGYIAIEYSPDQSFDGRDRYRYHIDIPSLGVDYSCDDLQSGCGGGSLQSGLSSLLTFLSACGESYPDGENADMFPAHIAEWAAQHSDDLSVLACELDETPNAIQE